jgi:hypothetical protein
MVENFETAKMEETSVGKFVSSVGVRLTGSVSSISLIIQILIPVIIEIISRCTKDKDPESLRNLAKTVNKGGLASRILRRRLHAKISKSANKLGTTLSKDELEITSWSLVGNTVSCDEIVLSDMVEEVLSKKENSVT